MSLSMASRIKIERVNLHARPLYSIPFIRKKNLRMSKVYFKQVELHKFSVKTLFSVK